MTKAGSGELLADVSVVVPVAPGDAAWHSLLPDLSSLSPRAEVLLVAAEPAPDPDEFAVPAGFSPSIAWVESRRGRAAQLNAGAARARNRFLWFLHADSRVDGEGLLALDRALRVAPAALHYFDLGFLDDGPRLTRLNAAGARFRSHVLGMPFGDQGLCLDRDLFERLGRFDEGARHGEDHLLVWAARRQGVRLRPTGATLWTSARKYRDHGWLRTTGRHLALTAWQAAPEFLRLVKSRVLR